MRNLAGIAIVALTALSCGISARVPQEPSEGDWAWLGQVTERAFDALMSTDDRESLVSYRSHRDLTIDTVERFFSIRFGPITGAGFNRDNLQATLVVPIGRSIQRQLLDLHMKDRRASFESVLSRVSVRRISIQAQTCPAIVDRMDALSKVRIQVPERDASQLHPFSHRIVIGMVGARIDATLYDETDSLVRWSIETRDALLACAPAVLGNGRNSTPQSR